MTAPATTTAGSTRPRAGARRAFRVEVRKLSRQLAIRLVALVCLIGPFIFAAIVKVQSGSPADSLYGVWVHSSGFAIALVLLGFAGSWGIPLAAGVVAGDMFSAEDRYGTWKMVLTRDCSRRQLFAGKLAAAVLFVVALMTLMAIASLTAGLLFVGDQSLVSLSGTVLSPGALLVRLLAAWLVCLPPALAFTSLGLLLSITMRNGIVGVIGPALAALATQLLLLVGSGVWVHLLLIGSAFNAWHALFVDDPFYGPLLIGIAVSLAWTAACLGVGWAVLRRRDFAGAAVPRRQGWVPPLRAALVIAAAIALLAIASNWGPTGVTRARLTADLTANFNSLTLRQQEELGRLVSPSAKLNVRPRCSRRARAPEGPGDWICTLNVYIPQPGANPFEQVTVTYDVSVWSDGCYKAQSPPSFIGQQLMRDASGRRVVNPLYTIYGCFNVI